VLYEGLKTQSLMQRLFLHINFLDIADLKMRYLPIRKPDVLGNLGTCVFFFCILASWKCDSCQFENPKPQTSVFVCSFSFLYQQQQEILSHLQILENPFSKRTALTHWVTKHIITSNKSGRGFFNMLSPPPSCRPAIKFYHMPSEFSDTESYLHITGLWLLSIVY